jgi:hypothetical protein
LIAGLAGWGAKNNNVSLARGAALTFFSEKAFGKPFVV